jgi:hypothetical protein
MSKPEIKLINYEKDVEVSFFDEDPDNDAGRAGDGYYFQLPGDESWDGAYQSETEALEEARRTLFYAELAAVKADLQNDGYLLMRNEDDDDGMLFVTKAKDRWFEIFVKDDTVAFAERFEYPSKTEIGSIKFDDGQETFGHMHRAVRQAAAEIASHLGFEHQDVLPRMVYDENAVTAMLVHETVREMNEPGVPAPKGLADWIKSTGSMELRFQCLKLAEEIDDLYASFKEFELDGVAFDEEFVPTVLFHAYDFNNTNENTPPKLDGGRDAAIAFVKRHFDIEVEAGLAPGA